MPRKSKEELKTNSLKKLAERVFKRATSASNKISVKAESGARKVNSKVALATKEVMTKSSKATKVASNKVPKKVTEKSTKISKTSKAPKTAKTLKKADETLMDNSVSLTSKIDKSTTNKAKKSSSSTSSIAKRTSTSTTTSGKAKKSSAKSTTEANSDAKSHMTTAKVSRTGKSTTTARKTSKANAKNTSKSGKTTKTGSSTKKKTTKNAKSAKVASADKKTFFTSSVEYYDLPYRYNETVVKILAQTPTMLFIYWDISDEDRQGFINTYGEDFFNKTKPVLIVTNKTMNYSFEVEINDFANSWYLHLNDVDCDYSVELGRRPIEFNNNSNIDNYVYITTSNDMEMPNNRILFDKLGKTAFFKNVKNNFIEEKQISSISFIRNLGKIYSVYELYKEMYKDELQEELNSENINLHLSSSSSSTFK